MQFDLTALEGSGAMAIVTAKNGDEIVRYQIEAAIGETKTVWLQLKGKILVQVIRWRNSFPSLFVNSSLCMII